MTPKVEKIALVCGISGQDGSYLAKLLLKKGYKDSDLPTNQTIWNKMKFLGYKRGKVAKTKPKKK